MTACPSISPALPPEPDPTVSDQQLTLDDLPVRPYTQDGQPSSGWSGTDTSRDAEPVRAASQGAVLAFVTSRGTYGATVAEVRDYTGFHHGIASGALSNLAKRGHLTMTDDKRKRCRVYVAPRP